MEDYLDYKTKVKVEAKDKYLSYVYVCNLMKKALQKMEKAVMKIMNSVDARDSTRLPCLPVAMRAY